MSGAARRRERVRQLHTEMVSQRQFYNLVEWVEEDPRILWEPAHAGCTLMHSAARCMRREQLLCGADEASTAVAVPLSGSGNMWKWILQKACCHHHNFLLKQDKAGETCIDCFLSSWVSGSREMATDFSRIVERVLKTERSLQSLRMLVGAQSLGQSSFCGHGRLCDHPAEVVFVARVWGALELLCRGAALGHVDPRPTDEDSFSMVAFFARTGRCPDVFARLLVKVLPDEARKHDANGFLPLHWWAIGSKPSPNYYCLDETLLGALLDVYPEAGTREAHNGQIPLHLALCHHNKSLRQVSILWQRCPQTLGHMDPVTNEYPFALAAVAARIERRDVLRGFHRRGPAVSLSEWLDTTRDTERARADMSCYLLGVVYEMLRAYPQALQDSLS